MSELSDDLLANASKPKRLRNGEQEREAHSLKDQIALDQHLSNQAAANKPRLAMRFLRTRPPGAT